MRALIPLVLIAACSAEWERTDFARLPPARADAQILDDEQEVRFFLEGGVPVAVQEVHRRVRIFGAAGRALARLGVAYDGRYRKVLSFAARTVAPDGRERHYGRGDAVDTVAWPGFALFVDQRAIILDLQEVEPGTIVELRYTLRFAEPWLHAFGQGFGAELPVAHARLTVEAPADWRVEWVAQRLGEKIDFAPLESRGETVRRTWERRDLPPLPPAPLAPPDELRVPEVRLRLAAWSDGVKPIEAYRDLRGLSAWLGERVSPPRVPEVEALAQKLVGDEHDPAARARKLFEWTRDQVRYCAIEIGDGYFMPHGPAEVLDGRYGDCKDKAGLLVAFLRAAGIDAEPVAIRVHDGMPAPLLLATVTGTFNHVIVRAHLPSGELFLDPTAEAVPFGRLPADDQAAPVLPLQRPGAAATETPGSTAEDNRRELELDLAVVGARLAGEFRLSATGRFAENLRGRLLRAKPRDRDNVVASMVSRGARIRRVLLERAERPHDDAAVEAHGAVGFEAALSGDELARTLRASELIDAWSVSPVAGERSEPIVLGVPRRVHDRVRISLEGKQPATLPEPVLVEGKFSRYSLRWSVEGTTLVLDREIELRERVRPAADWPEVRELLVRAVAAESRPILLRSRP